MSLKIPSLKKYWICLASQQIIKLLPIKIFKKILFFLILHKNPLVSLRKWEKNKLNFNLIFNLKNEISFLDYRIDFYILTSVRTHDEVHSHS